VRAPVGAIFFDFLGAGAVRVFLAPLGSGSWIPEFDGLSGFLAKNRMSLSTTKTLTKIRF